ncbi:MAG TPA: M6 family metalloprotease domain-containing protein [bacterium]
MKNTLKLMFMLLPLVLLAVPSNWKEVKTFTQPDGSSFQARLIGDEHYHFFEDLEGHTIVQNNNGWYTYAKKDNGLLSPTEFIVNRSAPPYETPIRPSAEVIAKLPENKDKVINTWLPSVIANENKIKRLGKENASNEEKTGILALTGQNALICLLGAFSDSGFGWNAVGQTPAANLERRHFMGIAFGDSVPPYVPDTSVYSMNNYYWEATYAKLKWMGDVDSIRSSGMTRAAANTSTTTYISNACTAANAYVNFANYDLDSDGDVDQLFVIHPGYGEEESGNTADIWSASYTGSFGTYDGKLVNRAVVIPENAKLGVFCHELFHQFASAPDLYDYDYDGNGVDVFCLMSSGSWNGNPGGAYPSHMCGYLKYDCDGSWSSIGGWLGNAAVLDSAELTTCGKYNITQLDSQPGTALNYPRVIMVQNTTLRSVGELFFLENRQLTGRYESSLPRSGLVIYHRDGTDMSGARYNNGPPAYQYYRLFTERNLFDPNWYYYLSSVITGRDTVKYSPNDFFAPFAADYGYAKFDSTTIPNCGRNTRSGTTPAGWGPSVTGISKTGYNMSFFLSRMTNTGSLAAISLNSYVIKDPVTSGTNNGADNLFNAGETDSLILTFYNSGALATAVQESLYTSDPYLTIVPAARKTIAASMANNSYASDASNPYVVQVGFNTPPNYTAQLKYKVWATGYADSGVLCIPVNATNIAWRFNFSTVTHPDFKPLAISVYRDTIFLSDGDSLPPLAGSWRLYKFSPTGALITSAANPGMRYNGACDIAADGNIYWSNGDTLIQTTRTLTTVTPKVRHYNVDWANVQIKRVRGVTFPPRYAPINYMNDSTFVYWHVYYLADGVTGLFEESLRVESRPASAGTALSRGKWVIPEGTLAPQDHWRNGRGIEHDGWRMWRICLFTNEIYRGRAPASASTSIDTLLTIQNPNHWGVYPGYDIDFQGKNPLLALDTMLPYSRGNKYYLWTTNIENSEVFKIDVTTIVLPSEVSNVTAVSMGGSSVKVKWDNKNYSTNPDSIEKVERYIVYRTTAVGALGDSVGYITASGSGVASDSFMDVLPGPVEADYWYRVSAVNWHGFTPGYSISAGPIVGIEENPGNVKHHNLFYDIAPSITGRRLTLQYEVAQDCKVTLKIYSTLGALIRTVAARKLTPGKYTTIWNLTDNQSRRVANGVYFVKFETDQGYERTQKLILNK